jgi:hypothetical protein
MFNVPGPPAVGHLRSSILKKLIICLLFSSLIGAISSQVLFKPILFFDKIQTVNIKEYPHLINQEKIICHSYQLVYKLSKQDDYYKVDFNIVNYKTFESEVLQEEETFEKSVNNRNAKEQFVFTLNSDYSMRSYEMDYNKKLIRKEKELYNGDYSLIDSMVSDTINVFMNIIFMPYKFSYGIDNNGIKKDEVNNPIGKMIIERRFSAEKDFYSLNFTIEGINKSGQKMTILDGKYTYNKTTFSPLSSKAKVQTNPSSITEFESLFI